MIRVMDLRSLLVRLVSFSALLSLILYCCVVRFALPDWPVYKIATISSVVAPVVIALFASNKVWRTVWKFIVRLDSSAYPDLNGTWEGTIQPSPGEGGAVVSALPIKVRIRQSMLETFIDFHGESFKSVTLAATPRIEQGQHYLYYIYRAEPQDPRRPPYVGTATLRVQLANTPNGRYLSLSGHYYTVRQTKGTINLKQVDQDPDQDVSYY